MMQHFTGAVMVLGSWLLPIMVFLMMQDRIRIGFRSCLATPSPPPPLPPSTPYC